MNSYLRKASCDFVPEGGSVVQLYYLSLPTIPMYEFPHEYPNNEEHERREITKFRLVNSLQNLKVIKKCIFFCQSTHSSLS